MIDEKRIFYYCPKCGSKMEKKIIADRERDYCPKCGYINYVNPYPAVAGIGIYKGKILLIQRGIEPAKGSWAPVSGFVEYEEDPEIALLREMEEEAGVKHAKVLKCLGAWTDWTPTYGNVITMVYLVELENNKVKAGDDASNVDFFSLDEVPEMRFKCFKNAFDILKKEREKWNL